MQTRYQALTYITYRELELCTTIARETPIELLAYARRALYECGDRFRFVVPMYEDDYSDHYTFTLALQQYIGAHRRMYTACLPVLLCLPVYDAEDITVALCGLMVAIRDMWLAVFPMRKYLIEDVFNRFFEQALMSPYGNTVVTHYVHAYGIHDMHSSDSTDSEAIDEIVDAIIHAGGNEGDEVPVKVIIQDDIVHIA